MTPEMREEIAVFTEKNSEWLPDYALFMALKEEKYHHMPVYMWPDKDVRDRKPAALEKVTAELRDEVDFRIFLQYIFFKQWTALREYANEKGIQIIGDIPIYVSADSSDVWTHPKLFKLKPDRSPKLVAGVPPDYYSATGQLWATPCTTGQRTRRKTTRVDLAHDEQHGAVRRGTSRPFSRFCRLLGGRRG